jgi:hypothetical protein
MLRGRREAVQVLPPLFCCSPEARTVRPFYRQNTGGQAASGTRRSWRSEDQNRFGVDG